MSLCPLLVSVNSKSIASIVKVLQVLQDYCYTFAAWCLVQGGEALPRVVRVLLAQVSDTPLVSWSDDMTTKVSPGISSSIIDSVALCWLCSKF